MTSQNCEYNFSIMDKDAGVRMVVLGVGGMGNNAIENLASVAIPGLELYSLNTDLQALRRCRAGNPVQLGINRTRGKGAGGDSEIGRLSAEDDAEQIKKLVIGAELVFIASGMGGGTGTGAAPVIARICQEVGVLSICVVTMPMACEGMKRDEKAQVGLAEMRKFVDSLLIIENETLSSVMDLEDISIIEVFRRADKVVVDTVVAVAKIINSHGYINLDLADLKKVIKRGDKDRSVDAFIGVGEASGPDRAIEAAKMALKNPLVREGSVFGAANLLINVVGSDHMGHKEAMAAIKCIVDEAGDLDREIFMGVVPDNSMGDKLSITIIATGLVRRNLPVVPLREVFFQDGKCDADFRGSERPRNLGFIDSRGVDSSQTRMKEPSDMLIRRSDTNSCKKTPDGFWFSPLIRKDEWQTPAYLRCRVEPHENPRVLCNNPDQQVCIASKPNESGLGLLDQTMNNQYCQSRYNMAG